jgi:hypothetical protein
LQNYPIRTQIGKCTRSSGVLFESLYCTTIPHSMQSFLQIPGYNSTEENEGDSTDEISLVLYEMRSLPELLPVLSVIPEVRMEIQVGYGNTSRMEMYIRIDVEYDL